MSAGVRTPRALANGAAALMGIQVGAAMVGSRYALRDVGVTDLALLRYALALAILAPVALSLGLRRWPFRDLLAVALLGVLQFAVVILLLNLALERLPAGLAALLYTTAPLQGLMLAVALRRERLTGFKVAAAVLALIGVGLALAAPLPTAAGPVPVLAALGSALAAALCSVLYRPYLARYPVAQVGALAMSASVAVLSVVVLAGGRLASARHLPAATWEAIVFVGISSGLGYLLLLWALRHIEASRVTLFFALGPIVALLLGGVLLGEAITPTAVVGTGLVVAALALGERPTRDR